VPHPPSSASSAPFNFLSCSGYLQAAIPWGKDENRNPLRAGLEVKAESWKWSSAAAHCGSRQPDSGLDLEMWNKRWSTGSWREYLAAGETEEEIAAIRQCTHTGRPLGTPEFLHSLEQATLRRLAPQKGGRPGQGTDARAQRMLAFER
jgi:hypothetical protein